MARAKSARGAQIVRKYTGVCAYEEKGVDIIHVQRAIQRSANSLLIGYEWDGKQYSLDLKRIKDNAFKGLWSSVRKGDSDSGEATCRIFPFNDGKLIFGTWKEDGIDYHWWVKLDPVARFDDEEKAP